MQTRKRIPHQAGRRGLIERCSQDRKLFLYNHIHQDYLWRKKKTGRIIFCSAYHS